MLIIIITITIIIISTITIIIVIIVVRPFATKCSLTYSELRMCLRTSSRAFRA